MFWVISVYFNVRNILPKSGTFLLGHSVYKRLFVHLNNNAILNEHHYGFRSEVSTENASHILLIEILAAMNSK